MTSSVQQLARLQEDISDRFCDTKAVEASSLLQYTQELISRANGTYVLFPYFVTQLAHDIARHNIHGVHRDCVKIAAAQERYAEPARFYRPRFDPQFVN